MEAYYGAMETYPKTLEPHPRAREVHPGALVAQSITVEAHESLHCKKVGENPYLCVDAAD